MKVIKKGNPQKGWTKQYKCTGKGNGNGGCGAILEVSRGDLFHTYQSYMGRDEDYFVTFECPECGVLTDINDSPFHPQQLLSRKAWCEENRCTSATTS